METIKNRLSKFNNTRKIISEKLFRYFLDKTLAILLAASGSTVFIVGTIYWKEILRILLRKILTSIHPQLPLYILLVLVACAVFIPSVKKCKQLIARITKDAKEDNGKISFSNTCKSIKDVLGEEAVACLENVKVAYEQVSKMSVNLKTNMVGILELVKLVLKKPIF
jgi:hypothetical protein